MIERWREEEGGSVAIDVNASNEAIKQSGHPAHQVRRRHSWFQGSLAAATGVLLAGAWLSSGTMAPYAATLHPEIVRIQQPCEYLTNIDHVQFQSTFWMLQGQ